MGYKQNVSLKTIAYELNVSINTVSRALRDCSDISEKTKKRVRQKAIELGYLPNKVIPTFQNGNSNLIALVINTMTNYYFMLMSEKIIYFLKKEGYSCVIICLYGNSFTKETVKECIYQRVDGIISFVEPTKESLDFMRLNQLQFVMVGRKIEDNNCDMLYTDDDKGGEIAAKYLIDNNAQSFIYINVQGSECSKRRYLGFYNYLKKVHRTRKIKKINIEDIDDYQDSFKQEEKIGLFVYNDEHAFLALSKLKEMGVDLENIVLIGYDAISQNTIGTQEIASIGFDYGVIAKSVAYCITTNLKQRERLSLCFDVKLYDKGEVNENN